MVHEFQRWPSVGGPRGGHGKYSVRFCMSYVTFSPGLRDKDKLEREVAHAHSENEKTPFTFQHRRSMMLTIVLGGHFDALRYEALPGGGNKWLRETLVLSVQDGFVWSRNVARRTENNMRDRWPSQLPGQRRTASRAPCYRTTRGLPARPKTRAYLSTPTVNSTR